MKTYRINGIEQEVSKESVLFHEFVEDLNSSLKKDSQVISLIKINGQELSEKDESSVKQVPIQELGEIDVFTANPVDLAYETLNTLDIYLDRILTSIARASSMYKSKNYVTADGYFVKSIDGLDLFIQTISGVKLALKVGLNPKVALAEASLISIMNDLLEAKRQNNYVFLAELLEKDLSQNILEWKNDVFKFFRTWKTA